jgi:hypothetical protein
MRTDRTLLDYELSDIEKYFAIDYATEAAERWKHFAGADRQRIIIQTENRALKDCGFNKGLANEVLRLFNKYIGR